MTTAPRYSIVLTPKWSGIPDSGFELCRVNTNPEILAVMAAKKNPRFEVRVFDHDDAKEAP